MTNCNHERLHPGSIKCYHCNELLIDIVGMNVGLFDQLNLNYRVVGTLLGGGCDLDPERYNIKIKDGIITSYTKG